jgi:PHD/YefM family antitoxin component YafN of YafNO toxin-antitoxin module
MLPPLTTAAPARTCISTMKNTYSITEAQRNLPGMVRELHGAAALTRHDEAVAYIVSREHWESVLETLEILADPGFKKHRARMAAGKVRYTDAKKVPA